MFPRVLRCKRRGDIEEGDFTEVMMKCHLPYFVAYARLC